MSTFYNGCQDSCSWSIWDLNGFNKSSNISAKYVLSGPLFRIWTMASAKMDPNHFTYTSLSEMVVWFHWCTQIYDARGVTFDLYFFSDLVWCMYDYNAGANGKFSGGADIGSLQSVKTGNDIKTEALSWCCCYSWRKFIFLHWQLHCLQDYHIMCNYGRGRKNLLPHLHPWFQLLQ